MGETLPREQVIALNDDITGDNVDSFLSSLRRDLDHEEQVPHLFIPGLFNVATDTTALRYGAVGAEREFYPVTGRLTAR
jgi:hypothetical protein